MENPKLPQHVLTEARALDVMASLLLFSVVFGAAYSTPAFSLPKECEGGETWAGYLEWEATTYLQYPQTGPAPPPAHTTVDDYKILVPEANHRYEYNGFWDDHVFNVDHWERYSPECAYIYSNLSLCKVWQGDYTEGHDSDPIPRGKDCIMISAQSVGNGGVDAVCSSPDVSIDHGEAVFATGVNNFVIETCSRTLESILKLADGFWEYPGLYGYYDLPRKTSLSDELGRQLHGAWSDTPHCLVNVRPHSCLCLAGSLTKNVESTMIQVSDDEMVLRVNPENRQQEVEILGGPFPDPPYFIFVDEVLQRRKISFKDVAYIVFSTSAVCWAIFGVSNYREVSGLQHMQLHALVFHYRFAVEPSSKPLRTEFAAQWMYKLGVLKSPPVVDGIAVEPIVPDDVLDTTSVPHVTHQPVPNLRYLVRFKATDAYTTPKQRNLEFCMLLLEGALMWCLLAGLSHVTDAIDNPFGPMWQLHTFRSSAFYKGRIRPDSATGGAGQVLQSILLCMAVVATCVGLIGMLLNRLLLASTSFYWLFPPFRGLHERISSRQFQNFLYLWLTNLAGVAELALVHTIAGVPGSGEASYGHVYDGSVSSAENREASIATAQFYLMTVYSGYASIVSAFAINIPALRITEDVFLVLYAVFQAVIIVYETTYVKDGEFAFFGKVADDQWEDCFDLFSPETFDHHADIQRAARFYVKGCQGVIAACADHFPDTMRLGQDFTTTDWSTVVSMIVVIIFKSALVWYERWMGFL